MKNTKKFMLFFSCFLLCLSSQSVHAKKKVSSFPELKELCETDSKQTIEIDSDIIIEEPIVIRGTKIIRGNGHRLIRSASQGKVYGGCLFLVQGQKCRWENITVTGNAKNKNAKGKIFGRIVEVRRGIFEIGTNCTLQNNVNENLSVNGGGAVEVGERGVCTMKAGTICNNGNVSGGGAFYVKKGGKLTIFGGEIINNKTKGIGAVEGFDGRGGAIYCEGSVTIKGGIISRNKALGFYHRQSCYGGVGGAIYIAAGGSLRLAGGRILNNSDDRNQTLWADGEVVLTGSPVIDKIYLSQLHCLKAETQLKNEENIVLESQNSRYYLIRMKKGFVLRKKTKKKEKIKQPVTTAKTQISKEKTKHKPDKKKLKTEKPKQTPKPEPKKIDINLNQEEQQQPEKGHVRFIEPEANAETEEVWYFSEDDIKKVQEYVLKQKKPFCVDANQHFMVSFEKSKGVKKDE